MFIWPSIKRFLAEGRRRPSAHTESPVGGFQKMGSQAGGGQDMALSVGCSGARGTERGRSGQRCLRQKLTSSWAFQLIEEGSEGGGGSYWLRVSYRNCLGLWGMGCADRIMEEALALSRNKCRKPGGRGGRGSLEKSWDSQEKWSVWVSSQLLSPAFLLQWSKRFPVLDALLGNPTSKKMDPGRLGRFGIRSVADTKDVRANVCAAECEPACAPLVCSLICIGQPTLHMGLLYPELPGLRYMVSPSSATRKLGDPEQVRRPLCASVVSLRLTSVSQTSFLLPRLDP